MQHGRAAVRVYPTARELLPHTRGIIELPHPPPLRGRVAVVVAIDGRRFRVRARAG
jgi:hypothetical protein